MGEDRSRRELLLAVALGSRRKETERRVLPDRRSGVDRRKAKLAVVYERRTGIDRRQAMRREIDGSQGGSLLHRARTRLSGRLHRQTDTEERTDGLR